ncbi:MAG: hypothetical protein AAGF73_00750 [Actinomycetota bacterium]
MTDEGTARRGAGVGLEVTSATVRGVRLDEGALAAAVEIGIAAPPTDRSLVDALVIARAELDAGHEPTRLATFPPGATLQRRDVTGLTGAELNTVRHGFSEQDGIGSTMIVDDGPRRWLMVIGWDDARVRQLEQLTELAGFADVTVEPSPMAMMHTAPADVTRSMRVAAPAEAFAVVHGSDGPIAAASVDGVGIIAPELAQRRDPVSPTWFDELVEPPLLAAELTQLGIAEPGGTIAIRIGDAAYPEYPDADVRAARRQCVALGAAIGAAGFSGPLRPVDTVNATTPYNTVTDVRYPWAIERVPASTDPTTGELSRPPRRRTLLRRRR